MKESHEKIPKELQSEWEQKLHAAGLPTNEEVGEGEELEIDKKKADPRIYTGEKREISQILLDAISDTSILGKFSKLTENMQDTIIKAIETLRDQGATDWEVVEKLGFMINRDANILSQKMTEFDRLTSDDSDKVYKLKPSFEEIKLAEEDEKLEKKIESDVDRLIKKLRELKYKRDKNSESEGKGKESGEGESPDPDKPKWVN